MAPEEKNIFSGTVSSNPTGQIVAKKTLKI